MSDTATRQRTPLFDTHVDLGARMVPFAGWEMPVQYSGVIAEHTAVRRGVGVFDVSHMGELAICGADAQSFLQHALSNDVARLSDGDAQYSLLLNENGGVIDDLIVYRRTANDFLLVVNAANTTTDLAHLRSLVESRVVEIDDISADWAMLAVQGPDALALVRRVVGIDLTTTSTFQWRKFSFANDPAIAATTGYTGELGCELLVPAGAATELWHELTAGGAVPCGLGARDTLRLEVCYPLHGQEMDATTDPCSSRLGWACAMGTGFVGEAAVHAVKHAGPATMVVPIQAVERGIPRPGLTVLADGMPVGRVTSGTMSPTLGIGIGMARVRADLASVGTQLVADVRGRELAIIVTEGAHYRR